jgi:hypothetical protein
MATRFVRSSIAGILLMTVCAASWADDMRVARVVVEGPEFKVYEYHQNLKAIVSAMFAEDELGVVGIDCRIGPDLAKSCDELSGRATNQGNVQAIYITSRELEHLTALVRSWARLQDHEFAPVELAFDMKNIPQFDCTNPIQAKQPCTNAPQCPFTTPRRCDKAAGWPCTSCGIP